MKRNEIIQELLKYYKEEYEFKLTDSNSLFECEQNLLAFLIDKGMKMMQLIFDEAGTDYQGREIKVKEIEYIFNDNVLQTIHGLFGPITYKRSYYLRKDKEKGSYTPLDEKLGIQKKHTPACNYFLTLHTGKNVYQESLDHFHEIFRPSGINLISMRKAEDMDKELGEKIEVIKQDEIKKINEGKETEIQKENVIKNIMAVSIDGTGIPHKLNPKIDKNGKKTYEIKCREAKSAAISSISWDEIKKEAHCKNTTYVSAMEDPDKVFERIYVEMTRRCSNLDEMFVVFLGDGAKWIYDRAITIFPKNQCVFILDFYHADERLNISIKTIYGEGTEKAKAQYDDLSSKMYNGQIKSVIEELKENLKYVKKKENRKIIEGNINYFIPRIDQMNYVEYRKKRYPIGSGTIESACKNVIGGRFKQGGMHWAKGSSDAMLQIRCSIKSGRFYDDFKDTLALKKAA